MEAGWFVDPVGQFGGRFFDGEAWTARVSASGLLQIDPNWPASPPAGRDSISVRSDLARSERSTTVPSAVRTDLSDRDWAHMVESIRYLATRPQMASESALPSRIAVVAALPREGVSTVSTAVSSVLSSDFDLKTCRVDLSGTTSTKPGAYEVANREVELADVLEWSGSAATLHCGAASPSEMHRLVRSKKLDALIAELSTRFAHVILDLPSMLVSSDGLAMMRLADAYLLVVKQGSTTLKDVRRTTDQLSGFESVGTVLNQARAHTPRLLSRLLRAS